MSNHCPDVWIIVRIKSEKFNERKILSGNYGGFADGDSWRLSSGITNIEEINATEIMVDNHSGSKYTLFKHNQKRRCIQVAS